LGFETTCQNCPQAKRIFRKNVSVSLSERKKTVEQLESIIFVAPSRWIFDRARSSFALRNCDLRYIPNPISDVFFQDKGKGMYGSATIKSDSNEIVAIFIAQDLSDPNKRILEGIDSFLTGASRAGVAGKVLLVGKNGSQLSRNSSNVHNLGQLNHQILSNVLDEVDLLISASLGESFGLVIGEAGAKGVPSIVLRGSGSEELVDHNVNGLTAITFDHLTELVLRFCTNADLRRRLSMSAREKWEMQTPKNVSKLYELLYAAS
jgi:glycosyltransferase involved in cell wall biosynthesis